MTRSASSPPLPAPADDLLPQSRAERQRAVRRRRRVGRLTTGLLLVSTAVFGLVAYGTVGHRFRVSPVLSGSMAPALPAGSAVLLEPVPTEQVRVGDVVAFHPAGDPETVVLHRVHRIVEPGPRPVVETKGDANATPDPETTRLVGAHAWRVRSSVPEAGRVIVALHRRTVRTALFGVSAVLLAVFVVSHLVAMRRSRGGSACPEVRVARRAVATVAAFGLTAIAVASPALAVFDPAAVTANATYSSDSLAAASGLTCSYTAGSTIRLDWTATASTWADGHWVRRKVDSGSFADYGSLVSPRTTVTTNDASATAGSTYSYVVQAADGTYWRSGDSNTVVSTACTGNVSTVAYPAVSTTLRTPEGVTVASNGDVYIADTGNNVIRKVSASTGLISTVAGTGSAGDGGNGVATTIALNTPHSVALDSSGNLYIADTLNHKVRRLTGTTLTTVAGSGATGYNGDGSPATSYRLYQPSGIAVDSSGNVYIADKLNCRIRKYTVATTALSTLAGNGTCTSTGDGGAVASATIDSPEGVAVDSNGDVYIGETGGHKIRKFTPGGNINKIAGTGATGYNGEGTATSAQLAAPKDVSVDASGNVYVADFNNKRIRKISGTTISTIAGIGTLGYTGEGYPATSSSLRYVAGVFATSGGTVYIADTNNDMIRMIDADGNLVAIAGNNAAGNAGDGTLAGSAALVTPVRGAIDSSNRYVFADSGDNRLRRFDPATGYTATIAGDGTGSFNGDGGAAIAGKLNAPQGVAVASNGDIYIADTGNRRVRKVSGGNISTVAGGSSTAGCTAAATVASHRMTDPTDVAVAANGDLYIADSGCHRIWKLTGTTLSTYVGDGTAGCTTGASGRLTSPSGLTLAANGDLYIADTGCHRVAKWASSSLSTVAGTASSAGCTTGTATSAKLTSPADVVFSGSDYLIADAGCHRVAKVSGTTLSTVIGTGTQGTTGDGGGATGANFDTPKGIAVDSSSNVYVSQTITNGRVRKVIGPL